MSQGGRLFDWLLGLFAGLVALVLYAPLAAVAVLSVFELVRRRGQLSLGPFSLDSYRALLVNADILAALGTTLLVCLLATALTLVLGLLFALYYVGSRGAARQVMQFLIFVPFLLPPVITGLSLLIFFREVDIARGLATIVAGHVILIVPVVYRTLLVRLQSLSRSLTEASYDLGATGWQTLRLVILPQLRTALIASGLLSFALSFDETFVTLFLSGSETTLPLRLWAMMRVGLVPEINALAVAILLFTAAMTVAVALLQWRSPRP